MNNRIIKTYAVAGQETRVALRTDDYSKEITKLDRLIAEAQKDFPSLKREEIVFIVYGGDRINGIPGIEFPLPAGSVPPNDYTEVHRLEYEK